jgi:hypothetical protein
MQIFVLFVLGDVLCLLPNISLRLCVYSAQCAGVCWLVAPKTKRRQRQVKLVKREDVVWQAGKA